MYLKYFLERINRRKKKKSRRYRSIIYKNKTTIRKRSSKKITKINISKKNVQSIIT